MCPFLFHIHFVLFFISLLPHVCSLVCWFLVSLVTKIHVLRYRRDRSINLVPSLRLTIVRIKSKQPHSFLFKHWRSKIRAFALFLPSCGCVRVIPINVFSHLTSCGTARSLNETPCRHRNTGPSLSHTLTTRRCYFLTRKPFTLPTYTIKSTNCAVAHTHTYGRHPFTLPNFQCNKILLFLFLLNPCLCVCVLFTDLFW